MPHPGTLYSLSVRRFATRDAMGQAAAKDVAATIQALLVSQDRVRMVFAAAPSQEEFLRALVADPSIDFARIEAFHMDEYVGLDDAAPQGFANFLKARLFDRVPFAAVHTMRGNAASADDECARYAVLLNSAPVDIVCMGIGENGHIAFNDPHEADFADPWMVKCVTLDEACRMQQVHDGCFATLGDVPRQAMTLTIPALMRAAHHFCIVPAITKARAVRETLLGAAGPQCPATAIRFCPDAALYLDQDSASLLDAMPGKGGGAPCGC